MRRLIILRHAKALRAPGEDDFDRPLSPRGRNDASIMGGVLAANGLTPDRVLVSSALRTRETWEEIAPQFPKADVQYRRDLYLADAQTLLAALEDEADAGTVMVVAHNPGVHSLAAGLLRRDSAPPSVLARLERGYPTSTALALAIDEAGRASYDGLYLVAEHGGGGGE